MSRGPVADRILPFSGLNTDSGSLSPEAPIPTTDTRGAAAVLGTRPGRRSKRKVVDMWWLRSRVSCQPRLVDFALACAGGVDYGDYCRPRRRTLQISPDRRAAVQMKRCPRSAS